MPLHRIVVECIGYTKSGPESTVCSRSKLKARWSGACQESLRSPSILINQLTSLVCERVGVSVEKGVWKQDTEMMYRHLFLDCTRHIHTYIYLSLSFMHKSRCMARMT